MARRHSSQEKRNGGTSMASGSLWRSKGRPQTLSKSEEPFERSLGKGTNTFIHSLFGIERDRMNRLSSNELEQVHSASRSHGPRKSNPLRLVKNTEFSTPPVWRKSSYLQPSPGSMNMDLILLLQHHKKDESDRKLAKKLLPTSYEQIKRKDYFRGSKERNCADLFGTYEPSFKLMDRSLPNFIFKKQGKIKTSMKQQNDYYIVESVSKPQQLPKKINGPIFSKMKSRIPLAEAKEYRLVDEDELEDQRFLEEIKNDKLLNKLPAESTAFVTLEKTVSHNFAYIGKPLSNRAINKIRIQTM